MDQSEGKKEENCREGVDVGKDSFQNSSNYIRHYETPKNDVRQPVIASRRRVGQVRFSIRTHSHEHL